MNLHFKTNPGNPSIMKLKKTPLLLVLHCCLLLLLLAFVLSATRGRAATYNPPQLMSYQGYVTDGSGNPLGSTNTGPKNYNVVFRIWDIQTGGTTNGADELYAEQQTVTVNNGYFSVLLGQGTVYANEPHTNLLSGLFTGTAATSRYVEITVLGIGVAGGNITIFPRLQLVTSPYSFLSANSVTALNAVNASAAASLVNPNNVQAVSVNTSGFVGIGTPSPAFPLDVNGRVESIGNASLTAGYWLTDAPYGEQALMGLDGNNNVGWYGNRGAGWGLTMNITNGDIGIGTSYPDRKLTVYGDADILNSIVIGDQEDQGNPSLQIFNYDGYELLAGVASGTGDYSSGAVYGDSVLSSVYGKLLLQSGAGAPGITITTANTVGIGTAAPVAQLDVETASVPAGLIRSSSTGGTWFDLANTSSGGGYWDIITTGSANGEGAGKLMFTAGTSPSYETRDVMVMENNGFVGIGTYAPNYPLDVELSGISSANDYGYLNSAGAGHYATSSGNQYFSIYAAARILTGAEFDAVSDARIKEVVDRSDTRNDLAIVRKLQITDYRKVDKVQYGGRLEKGVIAQEVETIVPEAVSTCTNFIPNIYASATSFACTNGTLLVTLAKPHGLVVGDKVRLITETGPVTEQVSAVSSPLVFAVDKVDHAPKQLFVFGKQVGDFRVVNYDRLYSTGLGAIQELAKRLDQVEARETHLATLEQQAAKVDVLEQEVADLKKLVTQLADAAKNSKLTAQAAADHSATLTTASLDR